MGFWLRPAADDDHPVLPVPPGHRAVSAPYGAPRSITASAERITVQNAALQHRTILQWQREAWIAYERVGEIHYGCNMLGGLLSRVRFYGAVRGASNEPPTDVESGGRKPGVNNRLASAVKDLVDDLFKSDAAGMIRSLVLNICVPGECLFVQLPATDVTPSRWAIRSTAEMTVRGDGTAVLQGRRDGGQQTLLPPGTFIARIWRRHPQHSMEPDSSLLGIADAIEELLMLQRLVRGATRSRLNAGLLFVPDGVASAVNPKHTAEPPVDEQGDPFDALRASTTDDPSGKFLSDLVETMTKPINDETSAATVVPMLVTGPGDEGAKIRHVTFERHSDQWLTDRIEKVLERILGGLDMPKEVITGMQHVKYSNAVVIDEGMYKASIEPLALVAADAFTSIYLYPQLRGMGFTEQEISRVVIWYDPSEIVTRPNASDEATQGIGLNVLSGAAWRRVHGYAESDAPSEDERLYKLLDKLTGLPDQAVVELLRRTFPDTFGHLADPPPQPVTNADPNVVQFPQQHPAPVQPPADPQRTAIKQVGVT